MHLYHVSEAQFHAWLLTDLLKSMCKVDWSSATSTSHVLINTNEKYRKSMNIYSISWYVKWNWFPAWIVEDKFRRSRSRSIVPFCWASHSKFVTWRGCSPLVDDTHSQMRYFLMNNTRSAWCGCFTNWYVYLCVPLMHLWSLCIAWPNSHAYRWRIIT